MRWKILTMTSAFCESSLIFSGIFNLFNDLTNGADIAVQHGNKLAFRVDCQLQAGIIFNGSNHRILAEQV